MDELRTRDLFAADDPFALFAEWQEAARGTEPNDPTAMTVASVDADGLPNLRMVLCRKANSDGFVFFTNFESAKGRELLASGKAAALFHWKTQRKQVRIRGTIHETSAVEADDYFDGRPRGSQLGAWASQQSRPLESREKLEAAVEAVGERFPDQVPRPPHWSGFRITPSQIEFWADGEYRLHNRLLFSRELSDTGWRKQRLYP